MFGIGSGVGSGVTFAIANGPLIGAPVLLALVKAALYLQDRATGGDTRPDSRSDSYDRGWGVGLDSDRLALDRLA